MDEGRTTKEGRMKEERGRKEDEGGKMNDKRKEGWLPELFPTQPGQQH